MWKVKIIRRTSPYNKYIKWFAEGIADSGATFSFGYKTQAEARYKHRNQNIIN